MFKTTAKLFISFLLTMLLINSNALAFHKTHQEKRIVYEDKKTKDGRTITKLHIEQ